LLFFLLFLFLLFCLRAHGGAIPSRMFQLYFCFCSKG
jgi:hypothetical protein